MSVLFDTLKLARCLEGAGFPPRQAGDMAEGIVEAVGSLATKNDLELLKRYLTMRLGGMMVVAVGVILAAPKLFH
jgi:hypothetical protein